jgi:hypothetical protein
MPGLRTLSCLAVVLAATALPGSSPEKQLAGARLVRKGMPIARIKESIICCPRERVYIDGWASIDVGGEVVEWLWDLDEDGEYDTMSTTGEMWIAAPSRSRSYSVILTVQDDEGNLSEPDTATVHVMETPPIVTMASDTVVKIGTRLHFRPHIVPVCGKLVSFEWDFDDDGRPEYRSSTNGNTSRLYNKIGKHFARFTVLDEYGREAGGLTVVHVVERVSSIGTPADDEHKQRRRNR